MKKFEITKYETLSRTSTYLVEAADEADAREMTWDEEPNHSYEKTINTDWEVEIV